MDGKLLEKTARRIKSGVWGVEPVSVWAGSGEKPGMPDKGYEMHLSYETVDPMWDSFVESTPGGEHLQTSLWAQLKVSQGWKAIRLIVKKEGEIIAGTQLLLLSLGKFGVVAYVYKAPLLAISDPSLEKFVILQLQELTRTHRIQFLVIQPPRDGEAIAHHLVLQGFMPSKLNIGPTATIRIDLEQDLDDILAGMKRGTRYNVRLGLRKGIRVWEGSEKDLRRYYEILLQTSDRQGFAPYSYDYFLKMWRLSNPHGFIRLFLAGFDDEVVCAQLAIPFRDTVVNRLSVWSGRHGDCRPNEVLQWSVIEWAKANGYRYYDLEGIKTEAAEALLQGEPVPDSVKQSVTSFKLGFGGKVVLMPGAYEFLYQPLVRWSYRKVFLKIAYQPFVAKLVNRMRTR